MPKMPREAECCSTGAAVVSALAFSGGAGAAAAVVADTGADEFAAAAEASGETNSRKESRDDVKTLRLLWAVRGIKFMTLLQAPGGTVRPGGKCIADGD
jgi:hypothetical protein